MTNTEIPRDTDNGVVKEYNPIFMGNMLKRQNAYMRAVRVMLDSRTSIRRASKSVGVCKSGLGRFIHTQLFVIDEEMYADCIELLKRNSKERNNFSVFPRKVYRNDGVFIYYDNKGESKVRV